MLHDQLMREMSLDLKARIAACSILGVEPDCSEDVLKAAYRREAKKHHPDHNENDPEAHRKFILIKCAYELLSKGKPCDLLLKEVASWQGIPESDNFNLDNPWGYFLWWRDKYF